MIAFASFRDGNYEIYVMNADGTNPRRLTNNPATDNQPDWGLVYNDAFAESRAIHGSADSIAGSTLAATRENGEPVHSPNEGGFTWNGDNSVWYRWTAPASGTFTIDTCETNFDTILSAYTGGSVSTLKRVADNNNACPSGWGSKLTFEATAGTVYNIAVSGAGGARAGIFTLKLALAVDTTPPAAPSITSPANNSSDGDGAFTVSGTAEPNSTVRLREGTEFKGGAQVGSNGAWSARLTGISDGSHTYVAEAVDKLEDGSYAFEVRATDALNHTDASPASRAFTVDTVAPTFAITSVKPAISARNVPAATNVEVPFSEAMDPATINARSFKLLKLVRNSDGSFDVEPVPAAVGYNEATKTAILDPESELDPALVTRPVGVSQVSTT